MAKLYFYYSAMNAGKTTTLLQSAFNYQERGMGTLCFLPSVVAHSFNPRIASRIGISAEPIVLEKDMDLLGYVRACSLNSASNPDTASQALKPIRCILVDEAQFLSKHHIQQLCTLVDEDDIPVLAYGLRTDFRGELFEGSRHLLAWADHLCEIKTVCFCGRKAIMTARVQAGAVVQEGAQVQCGGNESYVSLCRKHHREMMNQI